jgi:PEP-CTERM motif-containing protein
MPRILNILAATALTAGLAFVMGPSAWAQILGTPGSTGSTDPFLLNFDENGNATFVDTNGTSGTLQGTLKGVPGGSTLVLQFTLPEPVVTGTLSFTEPGGGTSDWLQFTDANFSTAGTTFGTTMIYTSDLPEVGEVADLADTGPPPLPVGNFLACGVSTFCPGEIGPEGNNGFDYRPGGVTVPYPANNEYLGISDKIPEPASLALLGSAIMATGFAIRRRRRQGNKRSTSR